MSELNKDDISFIPDAQGTECAYCGISSFAHAHRAGTLPRDFDRPPEIPPARARLVEPLCPIHGDKGCPEPTDSAFKKQADTIKTMVRDFTRIDPPTPKSEVEQRLVNLVADAVVADRKFMWDIMSQTPTILASPTYPPERIAAVMEGWKMALNVLRSLMTDSKAIRHKKDNAQDNSGGF